MQWRAQCDQRRESCLKRCGPAPEISDATRSYVLVPRKGPACEGSALSQAACDAARQP